MNIPIAVNTTPSINTRFFPNLDCSTLHGSDKMKNQMNTIDGSICVSAGDKLKSLLE